MASLHASVQTWVTEQGWDDLRPIQKMGTQVIRQSNRDLIISGGTGSGKTEAAFLPILSELATQPQGVGCLYMCPVKALINDQARRLSDMAKHTDVPIHRWHGDVSTQERQAFRDSRRGILLTTPETLESLLRKRWGPGLAQHLRFIVIDEMHLFPGSERGAHVLSLILRLERHLKARIRRVGISATLGDPRDAQKWLRSSDPDHVEVVSAEGPQREIQIMTRTYLDKFASGSHDQGIPTKDMMSAHFFRDLRQGTNLVFANGKARLESIVGEMRHLAVRNGVPSQEADERFLIHHGSLAPRAREKVEARLRSGEDCLCLCSGTLEVGIDIGHVESVGHINPPGSVASLAQRLGRSGRRKGSAQRLAMFLTADYPKGFNSDLEDQLHANVILGIACIELMLAKWSESPRTDVWYLSTAVHQILSTLKEYGRIRGPELIDAFGHPDAFRLPADIVHYLVMGLIQARLVEEDSAGRWQLTENGNSAMERVDSISAFAGTVQYTLKHKKEDIGVIPIFAIPAVENCLWLGGNAWRILARDDDKKTVQVELAQSGSPVLFGTVVPDRDGGMVRAAKQILADRLDFDYLDGATREVLQAAQRSFHNHQLQSNYILDHPDGCTIWRWGGTRQVRTVEMVLLTLGMKSTCRDFSIAVEGHTVASCLQKLASIDYSELNGRLEVLVLKNEMVGNAQKFDRCIPCELLAKQYVRDYLDIPGFRRFCDKLLLKHASALSA